VPETPEITSVYSATIQNYRQESVPVICVEWTVSDATFVIILGPGPIYKISYDHLTIR